MSHNRASWLVLALVCCGICASGCRKGEEVTVYDIPKPTQVWERNHVGEGSARDPGAGDDSIATDRLLGAIVPQTRELWFFKLTGPEEQVVPLLEAFSNLVKGLTFEGERPTPKWVLPEGWTEQAGNEFRFATLKSPGGLELSVSALPRAEGPLAEQILANVNRWRGQLGQAPTTTEGLAANLVEVPAGEGRDPVTFVSVTGRLSGPGMGGAGMGGPFSRGGGPSAPLKSAASPETGVVTESRVLDYRTPAGWKPGDLKTMRKAAFVISQGEQQAEVTVIDLGRQGNDLKPNVDRWRGQVGLEPTTAAELDALVQPIATLGVTAQLVELHAPQSAAKPMSILGVYAAVGGQVWFIKLQGDTPLAKAERDRFVEFVKSLKFRDAAGEK